MQDSGTTALVRLRAATRSVHQQLQGCSFVTALVAGEASKAAYGGFLQVMALLHAAIDRAGQELADPTLREFAASTGRRGRAAQRDLAALGLPPEPPTAALRESMVVAEEILWAGLAEPEALVGALYVMQGSRQGASDLLPLIAEHFGDDVPQEFWSTGIEGRADDWTRFVAALDAHTLAATSPACELATRLFVQLGRALDALHPLAATDGSAAMAINPEAGNHVVVTEARRLVAATVAGLRCWRDYPYYEARFGARGRRYGSSDSAWITALVDETEQSALRQLDWLAGLLTSRGMPTLLLERQLRYLHDELRDFVELDESRCAVLLRAADTLGDRRRTHLHDEAIETLSARFEAAAPLALADVASLVACAVADECDGHTQAVPSLTSWLADEARHGEAFSAAVTQLLADARSAARSTSPLGVQR
jgi:heme oxygenase